MQLHLRQLWHKFCWKSKKSNRSDYFCGFVLATNDFVLNSENCVSYVDTNTTFKVEVTLSPHGLRSPKYGLHLLSSVVHSVPRLSALGYSEDGIYQMNFARRGLTNKTYNWKWKLFVQFAHERSFDPFLASPAMVAQFLLHVTKLHHATLSTFAGYREALEKVLKLTVEYDSGTCKIISQRMKSFKRTKPINASRILCWSISFVLHVLFSQNLTSLTCLTRLFQPKLFPCGFSFKR